MKLSIIGFGHMGSAIIAGAIKAGVLSASEVTVAEKSPANAEKARKLGLSVTDNALPAVSDSGIVIVAVRPADLETLAKEIANDIPKDAVIVSICAGKRLNTLGEFFGKERKITRAMPNTPALVGEGMAAVCKNDNVSDVELHSVLSIFRSFGRAEVLPEELFDTVTAVSGSGPAYVYSFINALKSYAEDSGMTPEQATVFAAQTTLGAAKMVLSSDETPEKLKQNVCVPNGTTIEAVNVLDKNRFEEIIKDAAKACEKRSAELAK